MANTMDGRTHNQPSHEASVKGGQNSHANASTGNNKEMRSAGGGTHNQPSHEAQVKGGEHSHGGR